MRRLCASNTAYRWILSRLARWVSTVTKMCWVGGASHIKISVVAKTKGGAIIQKYLVDQISLGLPGHAILILTSRYGR